MAYDIDSWRFRKKSFHWSLRGAKRRSNLGIKSSYGQWDCFAALAMTAPVNLFQAIIIEKS
jgi:hypothetical protein